MGLLLGVSVHPANVPEREGARGLLGPLANQERCARLQVVWADAGYNGAPFTQWVEQRCGWKLEIVRRSDWPGFIVLPKRWVVERTFAWIGKCRRLSKDYEHNPRSSRAFILLAMIQLMIRRL